MRAIPRLLGVCAALTVCAPGTLHAIQESATAQVLGIVTHKIDGAPVAGAQVIEVGTARHAMTDGTGHFVLSKIPPGIRTIEVTHSGFETIVTQVELEAGTTLTIPAGLLALEPKRRGFDERKAQGRGVFVERGEIDGWNTRSTTELLRHIRGVRLQPSRHARSTTGGYVVTMTHAPPECSPIAFLDGAYLGKVHGFDLDATISASAIEAVEVYRGPTEVPPRFDVLGAQCGVFAFWTSQGG
jgi:hypothetical protein